MVKIVVDCAGEVVKFEDGKLLASKRLQEIARNNLIVRERVRVLQPSGDFLEVGTKEPIAILALLYSLTPGRAHLLEGPQECWDIFKPNEEKLI